MNKFRTELGSLYQNSELDQVLSIVFEKVCGFSKTDLLVKKDWPISDTAYRELSEIATRLKTNEPLQYVLGEAWFMDMRFEVNKDVLIPRPETEELVAWVIESQEEERMQVLTILDACTGSGCIAISLKKNFPAAHVTAYDKSRKALNVAVRNAKRYNLEIDFREDDALELQKFEANEKFKVIVSNPPYIGDDEHSQIPERVRDFEPQDALFTRNVDSLVFFKAIADFARDHLEKDGALFFEINQRAGKEICKLLEGKGFKEIVLRKDLSGTDRMIRAKSPKFES